MVFRQQQSHCSTLWKGLWLDIPRGLGIMAIWTDTEWYNKDMQQLIKRVHKEMEEDGNIHSEEEH